MSTHRCGTNPLQLFETPPPTTKMRPSTRSVAVAPVTRPRGGFEEGIVVSVQSLLIVLKYSAVARPVQRSDVPPITKKRLSRATPMGFARAPPFIGAAAAHTPTPFESTVKRSAVLSGVTGVGPTK